MRVSTTWTCMSCGMDVPQGADNCPNDGTQKLDSLEPGAHIVGPYVYETTIGTGGMGLVYKARHLLLDQSVAIKVLRSDLMTGQSLMRFQREGKVTSSLRHPNIITVYDLGVTERGQPYLVMDFLKGITLDKFIAREGALTLETSFGIISQICDALDYAHKNGVVHRDLKPGNVMLTLTSDGKQHVHLLDFGIAKLLGLEPVNSEVRLTKTGSIFGTPAYMSPEQCRGQKVDARSDIYSLGCLIYESLTGVTPYVGGTAVDVIAKHLQEEPLLMKDASFGREFPVALETAIAKMLKKDPNHRFQSIAEVKAALLACTAVENKASTPVLTAQTRSQPPSSSIFLGVALVCLIAALAVYFWTVNGNSPPQTQYAAPSSATQDYDAARQSPLVNIDKESDNQQLDNYVRRHWNASTFNVQDFKLFNVDDSGIAILSRLKNLRTLRLMKTRITGSGLKHLENLPIQLLDVSKTRFSDREVPDLIRIRTVKHLDLSETDVTDKGVDGLKTLKLDGLWLNNIRISDRAMRSISSHRNLVALALNGDDIGDAGASYLLRLRQLQKLELGRTKITDKSLEFIGKIRPLTSLNLEGTTISGTGLSHLKRLSDLKELNLSDCARVDATSVSLLQKALPGCKISFQES